MAAYRGALVVPQDLNLLKFTEFYAMAVPPPPTAAGTAKTLKYSHTC